MHTTLKCRTQDDMVQLGKRLGSTFKAGAVVSLRGSLGAGKTVFARGVARSLGIEEAIVSPTFTLVQEYEGALPLYHMDLYRIETIEDFEMIGGEDMLYSNGVCLIEWSEVIDALLPKDTVYISIAVNPDQSRTVDVEAPYDIEVVENGEDKEEAKTQNAGLEAEKTETTKAGTAKAGGRL